jgi:hypothetical protein
MYVGNPSTTCFGFEFKIETPAAVAPAIVSTHVKKSYWRRTLRSPVNFQRPEEIIHEGLSRAGISVKSYYISYTLNMF